MSDHYNTLEIPHDATLEEIKAAYRKLAKKYHPDKNRSEKAAIIFAEINKAYETLSNPEKKRKYDKGFMTSGQPGKSSYAAPSYGQPEYKKYDFTDSVRRKGKIFIWLLLVLVITIPYVALRYSSKYNYEEAMEYYKQGQIPLSLVYFDRAIIELGSRRKEASLKAISICYEKGYISQGIAFAQKGRQYIYNKGVRGQLAYQEGLGWEMLQNYEEADLAYKKSLKFDVSSDSVYIHLGMMHGFELDNYEEASEYFTHLIEISGLEEYRLQRGIIFQKMNENKKALMDLESFTKMQPDNGMGYFFLGISLSKAERYQEACKSFQKARDLNVEQSEAYLGIYCEEIN